MRLQRYSSGCGGGTAEPGEENVWYAIALALKLYMPADCTLKPMSSNREGYEGSTMLAGIVLLFLRVIMPNCQLKELPTHGEVTTMSLLIRFETKNLVPFVPMF